MSTSLGPFNHAWATKHTHTHTHTLPDYGTGTLYAYANGFSVVDEDIEAATLRT
jgi:hypothetical protein